MWFIDLLLAVAFAILLYLTGAPLWIALGLPFLLVELHGIRRALKRR